MAIENTAPGAIREQLEHLDEQQFRFACHPGVPCFTECCRKLRLLLTPYDILRLKNHLRLSAADFLDEYTEVEFDTNQNLSVVYLKMQDNERQTCPFVTAAGCQVYPDRPSACRTYPLARASRTLRAHGMLVEEDYFLLREEHCQGFAGGRHWSVEEWVRDQELEPYHEFNNLWMQIVTHPELRRSPGPAMKQQQMLFVASYNLDQFRKLVTAGKFLQLFDIPASEEQSIRTDDAALLRLAFKWIEFSLFRSPALKLRRTPGPG